MEKLIEAEKYLEDCILHDDKITKQIRELEYTYTDKSSFEVSGDLVRIVKHYFYGGFPVKVWWPRWWYPYKNSVVAYVKPKGNTIYVNAKFLFKESYTYKDLAATIAHELMHLAGYKHGRAGTKETLASVPYMIQFLVERADKLNEEGE